MWSNSPGARLPGALAAVMLAAIAALCAVPAAAETPALPDSLGRWYKPQNQRQVWLHTMFSMRRELQALREYAADGEGDLVVRWARRLDEHYRDLPDMVPEWRDEVDVTLTGEIRTHSEAGDIAGALRAADRLERDCRACHRQYQALAALRYRWPRFDDLELEDADGNRVGFTDHMQTLSSAVNRVRIAASDDRWSRAGDALVDLRHQMNALAERCNHCHADPAPRDRILGREVDDALQQLSSALSAHDKPAASRLLGEVAVQSCARCHGVHRFASQLQRLLFR